MSLFVSWCLPSPSGAFIESLALFLELLYLPGGALPPASQCFAATGAFSSLLSLQPNEQYPAPAAAAALLNRARENYSIIKNECIETDVETGDGGDTSGTLQMMHIYLPHFDSQMQSLLVYDAAVAPSSPAVGPTLLVSNSVPFIPGLRVGLDTVSLYIGVNLPLQSEDGALRDAIKNDCEKRQEIYFQLRAPAVAARSMFLRLSQQPFAFGIFSVPCSIETRSPSAWPPETPESFIDNVSSYSLEMSTLPQEAVYRG